MLRAAGTAGPTRVDALDGIRALAVAAVVLYHADAVSPGRHVAPGGFLGVSVFFTLSGYLIGGQLLATASTPGVQLGTFARRRIARLVPAALAVVAAVLALSRTRVATWGVPVGFAPPDVMTAITQVTNWHLVQLPDEPVFRLIGPLAHFWSLSVEAQWYVALTATVAVLWWSTGDPRARRRRLIAVAATAWVASVSVAIAMHGSLRREEFGSDVRLAEFATGIVLAGVAMRAERTIGRRARTGDAAASVGVALLAILTLVTHRNDAWLGTGGYAALSIVWGALIVGALHGPRAAAWLGCRPLAAVGRASYSAYLVHWPIVLLLTDDRVPGGRVAAIIARVIVAAAAATVLHVVVERPARRRLTTWPAPAVIAAWAAATFVLWVGSVIRLGP